MSESLGAGERRLPSRASAHDFIFGDDDAKEIWR